MSNTTRSTFLFLRYSMASSPWKRPRPDTRAFPACSRQVLFAPSRRPPPGSIHPCPCRLTSIPSLLVFVEFLPRDGEIEGKGGPFPLLALHVDVAMVILHGPPDNRQTQSRPAPSHDLLRIERLEDLSEIPGGDAHPAVGYRQDHVIPFLQIIISLDRLVQVAVLRPDGHLPPARYGLCRVGNQVHDRFA